MKEKQSYSISHIKDLKPDAKNARKHNPRNIGAIVDSLQAVGAGRSIVVDEHNTILAGNGLIEAAAEAGITKLKIVEADGSTIIAVRRTGLTKKQKTLLALSDNRTNELSEWDGDNLRELLAGLDDSERIKLALAESDLKALNLSTEQLEAPADFGEVNENIETEHQCPKCGYKFSGWKAVPKGE